MKKNIILLILLIASFTNVNAATKKCVASNYEKVYDYTSWNKYKIARDAIYNNANLTKHDTYSDIKCKQVLQLETPGIPNDMSSNNFKFLSGTGFNYEDITVKVIYDCYGIIQYEKLVCAWQNAKTDAEKQAIVAEYRLYRNWTSTEFEKSIPSDESVAVTIDMRENTSSSDSKIKEMNAKLNQNSTTTRQSNTLGELEVIKSQNKTDKLEKILCSDKKKCINSSEKKEGVTLWQKKIIRTQVFKPADKQIILSGSYTNSTEGVTYGRGDIMTSCPSGATCKTLDNKLYTDFSMKTGIHPLKVTAKFGSSKVTSDCGYIIYNKGGEGWRDLLNYRQVDPSAPFPNGAKGVWKNKTGLFGNEYKALITTFDLGSSKISEIRNYNKNAGAYKIKPSGSAKYPSEFMKKYMKAYYDKRK